MTVKQLYDGLMKEADKMDERGAHGRAHELRGEAQRVASAESQLKGLRAGR